MVAILPFQILNGRGHYIHGIPFLVFIWWLAAWNIRGLASIAYERSMSRLNAAEVEDWYEVRKQ